MVPTPADRPVVLVVQHEPQCPPGRAGRWLETAGVRLDVRTPYDGQPLPDSVSGHEGLVVLGGHMSANDDETVPWLPVTKALLRDAAEHAVPALGICLGHQLAATALGGRVEPNPLGQRRGVLDMGWLPEAAHDPVLSGCGPAGVQWHHDIVTRLPPGTVELGRADSGELMAARFAPTVWGVQSHPEAGPRIVRAWADSDLRDARSEQERSEVADRFADVVAAREDLERWWVSMGTAFAAQVLQVSSPNTR